MDCKTFHYHEEDDVAVIRLERPERLNALTFDSYAELRDTFRALATRDDLRSVLLTGTGRAFCSGGDVRDIIGRLMGVDDGTLYAFTRMTCDLIGSIRQLEKPVVGALNGTTCGAGAVMAAACDIRVAAESARIAFLFTKVGLSGADMGAAWLLPRIVGHGLASELLMLGEFIDAKRAESIGLYNQVVPDEELADRGLELAGELASGPALGLAVTKRMLDAEWNMSRDEAFSAEAWIQAECMKHPDYEEAYRAFVEKRHKDFRASGALGKQSGARS